MKKKEKKARKKGKIYRFSSLLLLIVSLLFLAIIIYINILPSKYLFLLIGAISLLDIILIYIMLKQKKRKKLRVISTILSLIISLILAIGSFYIFQTRGLLNNMNLNYKTYNYSVIVLKDSNYEKIKDLKNKTMGYFDCEDNESLDKSLDKIDSVVKVKLNPYEDLDVMSNDLLNNKTESLVLEDSYYKLLTDGENNTNSDFANKTKVIYTFSVTVKTSNVNKQVNVTKEPYNIYLSGIDTYGTISSVSRSDVNIVMTVNPNTKQILLTSIPRDYYVQLSGTSGYKDKLTHAGMYGVEKSISTIEDLLDIDINYYFKVNFTSVIDIINAIGGVDVYSEYSFTSEDGYYYTKGYNSVNGEEALSFVRERHAFSDGDRQRGKNQEAMIEAIIRKCTSPSIITKYNSLLKSIDGSFVTNMSSNEITSIIKMQISDNTSWTVTSNSLTGTDSSNYTYSYSSQKLYVMEPDEESVSNAKDLINRVTSGEELDGSYDSDSYNSHSVTKSSKSSSSSSGSSTSSSDTKQESTQKQETVVEDKKLTIQIDSGTTFDMGNFSEDNVIIKYGSDNVTDDAKLTISIKDDTGTLLVSVSSVSEMISKINSLESGTYTISYLAVYDNKETAASKTITINEIEKESIDNFNE